MKKTSLLAALPLLLASCAAPRLYYWGSNPGTDDGVSRYERLTYQYYNKQSPESICDLLCLYEEMVTSPGGTRGVVPPGICAEYGYLLLQPETATAFAEHASRRQKKIMENSELGASFYEKGVKMLEMEIKLYPEAEAFIAPLLKKLSTK